MLGRIAARYLALFVAIPSCYNAPQPACGFVCGPAGACPSDYTCAQDNRCHLNGTAPSMICGIDAAVADAPPDGDVTPPFVVAQSPPANAVGMQVDVPIFATFNEPVTNVSSSDVLLAQGPSPVFATVTYNPSPPVAALKPTYQLAPNTLFTVALTAPITDLAGNPLAFYSWTFQTGADNVAPNISYTIPTDGQPNVPINSAITVAFDEPVVGVDTTSFVVSAGSAITGTITSSDGLNFVFTPTALMPSATEIFVSLSSAIQDSYGNAYVGSAFAFTTM